MVMDVWATPLESVENMGPQMKGIIETIKTGENTVGFGFITPDNGDKNIFFSPFSLASFDPKKNANEQTVALKEEFSKLSEKTKVTFNIQDSPNGPMAMNVTIDTSAGTAILTKQTENTVAWIIDWGAESVDDNVKMLEKLNKLEGSLKKALELYNEQYGQDFGNIQAMGMNIEYGGFTEGLKSEIIDLQGIFAGLHGVNLSDKEISFFRGIQSRFMRKTPEVQAAMLYFFDMVDTYVTPKNKTANQISLHKNPLKEILFDKNDSSYNQWIGKISQISENDENFMIAISKYIRFAEDNYVPSETEITDVTYLRNLIEN